MQSHYKSDEIKVSLKKYKESNKSKIKRLYRKTKRIIKKWLFNINKNSVSNIIKSQNKELIEMVNSVDGFFMGWNECCPQEDIFVGSRGHIVLCTEMGCHLWKRIEITKHARGDAKLPLEFAKKELERLLKQLPIKRFYDQDGCNGLFYKVETDKYGTTQTAYCYLNPRFKDGYFENHTLETQFVEIR